MADIILKNFKPQAAGEYKCNRAFGYSGQLAGTWSQI
jgi:hypothetical protein